MYCILIAVLMQSILEYDSANGTIRPYLSLQLVDFSIIKSATIGPATSRYLSNVLKQMFWRKKVNATIQHSAIRM